MNQQNTVKLSNQTAPSRVVNTGGVGGGISCLIRQRLSSYRNKSPLWLKGAVMALAMTGGSLVAADLAVAPTHASSISLGFVDSSGTTLPNGNITITPDFSNSNNTVFTSSHTIRVTSDYTLGFDLTLMSANASGNIHMIKQNGNGEDGIGSITGDSDSSPLGNNNWGYTLKYSNDSDIAANKDKAIWSGIEPYGGAFGRTLLDQDTSSPSIVDKTVYYGVKVDDTLQTGIYEADVVYTATAKLPADPTVTKVDPNTYELCDNCSNKITITGSSLDTVTRVYIDTGNGTSSGTPNNGKYDDGEECTNLTKTAAKVTCLVPTLKTNPNIPQKEGTYNIIIESESKSEVITLSGDKGFTYTYNPVPASKSVSADYGEAGHVTVDYDENMIPVWIQSIDDTSYSVLTVDPKDQTYISHWFNYQYKKWANAVTVKDPSKYIGTNDTEVDPNDILGYWVYIPRYAYEVQRRDATDKYVAAQDFDIRFETKDDIKKIPRKGGSTLSGSTLNAVDYREYNKDYRTYPTTTDETGKDNNTNSSTTWATHPAFSWQSQDGSINEELNGIWVGKFETTGSIKVPTILPNQYHKANEYIGVFYDIAKSIGKLDCNNNYGNGTSTSENAHGLLSAKTHMLKNSEWGAVSYLSSSKYGAGVNNVQINGSSDDGDGSNDGDGKDSASITGCGPSFNGGTSTYTCVGKTDHQWQSTIGQLASTTGNVYGIYDMAGGAYEYVMGNRTTSSANPAVSTSSSTFFRTPTQEPYVDFYKTSAAGGTFGSPAAWSSNTSNEYLYNNDQCDWLSCGGQALHETKTVQSVSSYYQSWGGDYSYFVYSSYPWFRRGGNWNAGSYAGLFYSFYFSGYLDYSYGFRVSLLVPSQG